MEEEKREACCGSFITMAFIVVVWRRRPAPGSNLQNRDYFARGLWPVIPRRSEGRGRADARTTWLRRRCRESAAPTAPGRSGWKKYPGLGRFLRVCSEFARASARSRCGDG